MIDSFNRRLPAEWEEPSAILLAWPHADTDWAPILPDAQACIAGIADALTAHGVPIIILTAEPDCTRCALEASLNRGLVRMVSYLTNDTWTRDYGPITCRRGETMLPIDFRFDGWGLKFPADRDNMANSAIEADMLFNAPLENRRSFTLEGGSIDISEDGTLLTTSRCLLSPNRNGAASRADIELCLREALGAERILWLEHGALAGDDTDSHIDTLARFAPGRRIIYCSSLNSDDPNHDEITAMGHEIEEICADGNYTPVPLPLPDPVFDPVDGSQLPATYANFLAVPGLVLVPTYRQPDADNRALRIIAEAFPGFRIQGIDCSTLIRQHGSLHCTTMQIPLAALNYRPQ